MNPRGSQHPGFAIVFLWVAKQSSQNDILPQAFLTVERDEHDGDNLSRKESQKIIILTIRWIVYFTTTRHTSNNDLSLFEDGQCV